MTDRLYYADPYCREFERHDSRAWTAATAGRSSCSIARRSTRRPAASRSIQAFSRGPLAWLRRRSTRDDGTVVARARRRRRRRRPDRSTAGAGPAVSQAAIDWRRRFDHMQQHTGQHVLSAACRSAVRRADRQLSPRHRMRPRSIWLASCPATEIAAAEAEANRVVWENQPCRFASSAPKRRRRCRCGRNRLREGTSAARSTSTASTCRHAAARTSRAPGRSA